DECANAAAQCSITLCNLYCGPLIEICELTVMQNCEPPFS
uniref:Mating pheromone Er-11 n=2 Tax=Euplotes raikovi TaxID=5938 RepID=MER11_EUPRA|nr:RecName: Full=Mating pheromone Er-11; AltName: Full=Euplomone R11 [Euplotes raikovi]AAB21808.1 pheromone Er-11 [Euplotes raikovi=ciliated protozoa, Peptide, 39 aa] [Euplotes raikovi]1ERY_A Chain A, PHEROMONE ER-11 [Euplotes raikovi]